jgi:hypothetical protein
LESNDGEFADVEARTDGQAERTELARLRSEGQKAAKAAEQVQVSVSATLATNGTIRH